MIASPMPVTERSSIVANAKPDPVAEVETVGFESPVSPSSKALLEVAEQKYQVAFQTVESPSEDSVEAFLESTIAAWNALNRNPVLTESETRRLLDVYHSSLLKFVQYVEEYGRRDPRRGVRIATAQGDKWLPVKLTGFNWKERDIHDLILTDPTAEDVLGPHHLREGIGVPLIGLHFQKQDRYLPEHSAFPVTCVLHVDSAARDESVLETATIELIDPRNHQQWTAPSHRSWQLAADFTAHWEWYAKNSTVDRVYGFRHPDASGNDVRLTMLEPYQPGKIPVIFVHGLLSDPTTWIGLANEIETQDSTFYERYQVMAFRYPTGKSFLDSANDLRRELKFLFDRLWEETQDPALFHAILIGHSMGGLLSRFQVTHSGDEMWRAFSDAEMKNVRLGTTTRQQIKQIFFFEPSRYVERVVFVATPHNGSRFAEISIGKLATMLVERKQQKNFERVLAKNPGRFKDRYDGRMPTSTDLLVPNNPVLKAMEGLDFAPRVHLHSIIGTGQFMLGTLESDGVVPVESARILGVESERLVHAKHNGIQSHPDTVAELNRIFTLHWQAVSQMAASKNTPFPTMATQDE